jgi:tetratricopeptide (TPR) repeat protein
MMASYDDIEGRSHPAPEAGAPGPKPIRGVFAKEGELWTIAFGGELFRLRDSKGLAYIAHLLRYPAREFHSLDLVGGTSREFDARSDDSGYARSSLPRGDEPLAAEGIHIGGLGDAGEMLDEKARAQYRRRLTDLREELEEAKQQGMVERAENAESEIETLTAELSRAVGLGGRVRRAASASERARQSVTRAIKAVIERIRYNNAQLGDLLARCIRTGISCAYYPVPDIAVVWEFWSPAAPEPSVSAPDPAAAEAPAQSTAPASTGPDAIPAWSSRSHTPFVGRQSEFEHLWSLAQRASQGAGALALLAGGPGVGKTRLARELAARASQLGFASFSGRCYERDEPHPLIPFVEFVEAALAQAPSVEHFRRLLGRDAAELAQIAPGLRRAFPDLPPAPELPPSQIRRFLFQSLFDFVARVSRVRPLLLVLEDLHWADESTLVLVNFVANRIEHVPAMVLATFRDGALDANSALTRTLEELLKLGVRPTKLDGLPRGEVVEMLAGLSRLDPPDYLVDAIFDETQGNPFFVEEVFSHLAEEGKIFDSNGNFNTRLQIDELFVPDNVRLVLGRRLARLSDDAREVLSAASVIGRSFSFMLLESVLDRMATDALFQGVEEAQHAGLIAARAGGPEAPFAFSHELVRQTLLTGLSQPRRQRLHLKIAEAMEKIDSARLEDRAAEIAHHLVKSGAHADAAKTSHYLALAGHDALNVGAYDDARRSLEGALSYKQSNIARRAELMAGLAAAERGSGNWEAALAHLHDSLEAYAAIGDQRMIGRIVFDMVEGLVWTGRFDEAAATADRGLARLQTDEDAYRARLLAARGLIYSVRGEFEPAMKSFDEAMASRAVTPFLARVLAYRSVCDFYFLRLREALSNARKSAELSNPRDSPWTHSIALSRVMLSLFGMGKVAEAAEVGRELRALAHDAGQLAALSYCISTQAWTEFGREADLGALDRTIAEILERNRSANAPLFLSGALAQMSLVKFFAGSRDTARSLAQEARSTELPGAFDGLSLAALIRAAPYSDARQNVFNLLTEARPRLPKPDHPNPIGSWALLTAAVEGWAMIGERERAAELYPLVQPLLDAGVVCLSFVCRFPETVAGIAAGAAGEWAAAEGHFLTALQQAESSPHRLEQAEVHRFHAVMMLERGESGDVARAREMLTAALDTYQRIGMPRHCDLTRALLARTNP